MATIGAFEAKTHLSQLLERVEAGEQFTITRHGRPVAKLMPVTVAEDGEQARARRLAAIEALRKLSAGVRLNPPGKKKLTIRQLIEEGRE